MGIDYNRKRETVKARGPFKSQFEVIVSDSGVVIRQTRVDSHKHGHFIKPVVVMGIDYNRKRQTVKLSDPFVLEIRTAHFQFTKL